MQEAQTLIFWGLSQAEVQLILRPSFNASHLVWFNGSIKRITDCSYV